MQSPAPHRAIADALDRLTRHIEELDRAEIDAERAHQSLLTDLAARRARAHEQYIQFASAHCPHTHVSRDRSTEYARRSTVLFVCDLCGIRVPAPIAPVSTVTPVFRDITNSQHKS